MEIVGFLLMYLVFAWAMGRVLDAFLERVLAEKPKKIVPTNVIPMKSARLKPHDSTKNSRTTVQNKTAGGRTSQAIELKAR